MVEFWFAAGFSLVSSPDKAERVIFDTWPDVDLIFGLSKTILSLFENLLVESSLLPSLAARSTIGPEVRGAADGV